LKRSKQQQKKDQTPLRHCLLHLGPSLGVRRLYIPRR
jgi:hypothetical protein